MARVVSLVTLYYPKKIHIDNIINIAKQSDSVVLCDNTPYSSESDYSNLKNVDYVFTGENNGLSKAFNNVLKADEYKWCDDDYVLFFDQDSKIPQNHVERLVKEYEKLVSDSVHVGCIGPVYYDTSFSKEMLPRDFVKVNEQTMFVSSILTTSMLCKYGNLRKIGFWNEDIFLDLADWDVCWRLADFGFKICLTSVSVIKHSVGIGKKNIGPITFRVGNPYREYYQIRDCLKLLFRRYTPLKYKMRFIAMLTIRSIIHVCCFNEKKMRAKYILKGLYDYCRGKNGALK